MSIKSQIFTKTIKIAGKQVLFYVTSTNTKSFKRYSVSFPASENRDYKLSVRDTRVFTDNPKVKHCSGFQAPELSKKQLKFLLSAFI